MGANDPGIRPLILLAGFGYYALFGGWPDTVLLLLSSAWRNRHVLAEAVCGYVDPETLKRQVFLLPGFAAGFVFLGTVRFFHGLTTTEAGTEKTWTTVRPLLIPAKTTHRRTFPEKHDFAYSYLVVGIPVGWKGTYGGMISSDVEGAGWRSWVSLTPGPERGWFDVDPADYLLRGSGHLGLRGKLDAYLESQGVDPSQYPHAYLVTAAKFLGYSFNPVSFWYLYSASRELTAMILEVNNTFDERRMYFLPSDDIPDEQRVTGGEAASRSGDQVPPIKKRMTKQWTKDFHVSPFNSRKGSYSLSAADFFSHGPQGMYNLDTTITLRSSKDHPKLVARLFSSAPAIDPVSMTLAQKLLFLCAWCWVGFVTFPRIAKEAAALFFRRGLHVWYRPEPLKDSIGRTASAAERRLEPFFRDYLRHLVAQSPTALAVTYIPSGLEAASAQPEMMCSPAAEKKPKSAEHFDFKILTPAFYTRFVHYAHDLEAVCCEFQDNATIWISRPELLPKLLLKKPAPPLRSTNILDYVYFRAIRALRQRPERIERPLTSNATPSAGTMPGWEKVDIRDFRISSMDGFVLGNAQAQKRGAYRSLVLRTFLAERVALGSAELLDLQHMFLRAGFAWVLSSAVAPLFVSL